MPVRRRDVKGSSSRASHRKQQVSSSVCGSSPALFIVLLFTAFVISMYAYFFYSIVGKRGGGYKSVDFSANERIVRADPNVQPLDDSAKDESNQLSQPSQVDRSGTLKTVPNTHLFLPIQTDHSIRVEGGDQRIWFVGKDIFVEIACSEEQFKAMQFEIHGPTQFKPQQDIRTEPMGNGFKGFIVSYTPIVAGHYTFVINDLTNELDNVPPFQRSIFHKVIDENRMPRTHIAAIEQLRRHIYEIQNPPDCSTASLYLYNLNHGMNYGVGVNTEYMVAAFGAAMAENRTFVLPTKKDRRRGYGFYWADGTCDSDSWMCFFFPVSKCTEADIDMDRMVPDSNPGSQPSWSSAKSNQPRVVTGEACPKPMGPKGFQKLAAMYAPFEKTANQLRGRSNCEDRNIYRGEANCLSPAGWVVAQLTEYIFRPLPWLVSIFDEAKYSDHDWNFPLTTVHIRKTDKLKGNLREAKDPDHVYDLKNYFQAVDELTALQAPKKVKAFIATDSDKVIKEIKDEYLEGRNLLFDEHQTRYEKGTILQLREHPGSVNQKEESVNALKDIWLLSQGNSFIGTRSSFFGRTGFFLMYASGRMEAYRLLDSDPWGSFPIGNTLCF